MEPRRKGLWNIKVEKKIPEKNVDNFFENAPIRIDQPILYDLSDENNPKITDVNFFNGVVHPFFGMNLFLSWFHTMAKQNPFLSISL